MVLTQASFMSALFTNFRYSDSSSRPKRGATRRLRWLIICATVSAIVAATSVAVKTILDRPSWLHVIGYNLLLPCCFAASGWMTNKGQKGRLLEGTPYPPILGGPEQRGADKEPSQESQ